MGNIFESREIYKKIPKDFHEEHPLRAIRGAYVVGYYNPIYLTDPTLTISGISGTKAKVVDYTTAYQSTYEDSFNISMVDLNIEGVTGIERYTKIYASTYEDAFNISIVDLYIEGVTSILRYTKSYQSTYEDSFNIAMVDFNVYGVTNVDRYKKNKIDNNTEPTLRIKSINTTIATISDVQN